MACRRGIVSCRRGVGHGRDGIHHRACGLAAVRRVDPGRLDPLGRRGAREQTGGFFREEFRAPLGVRKSPRNEPAVCGLRLMEI